MCEKEILKKKKRWEKARGFWVLASVAISIPLSHFVWPQIRRPQGDGDLAET